MPRRNPAVILEILADGAAANLPLSEKLRQIAQARAESPDSSTQIDLLLLERIQGLTRAMRDAEATLGKLKATLDKLESPPLFAARFWAPGESAKGPAAWIVMDGRRRLVPLAENLAIAALRRGDGVLVNANGVLIARAECPGHAGGDTAAFERRTADGRLLVRRGTDLSLVHPIDGLKAESLKPGDMVRLDATAGLAFERVESNEASEFLVEAVPDLPLQIVGGQDRALQQLVTALTLALSDPGRARRYGLPSQRLILLLGPPGTGKTLMARVAAAHLQRLMGKRCTMCVVKPGQFEDPFVGVTQKRIRECFKALKSAGEMGILFLDEIESLARTRGNLVGFHNDKFLAAMLAELQGFDTDPGANLVVIGCTNKLSLLDPAIVERFDVQIPVDRPNLDAARAILSIHLPASLPFHPNGDQAAATRQALIERAVTHWYSPNADNQIARVRFRDGTEQPVNARALASGRCLSQIAQAACQRAALREMRGDQAGLTLADIDEAVCDAIAKLSGLLTRENIHHYLTLPQDKDVVAVEAMTRRVPHPHRFLAAS